MIGRPCWDAFAACWSAQMGRAFGRARALHSLRAMVAREESPAVPDLLTGRGSGDTAECGECSPAGSQTCFTPTNPPSEEPHCACWRGRSVGQAGLPDQHDQARHHFHSASQDELTGPRVEGYRRMIELCPPGADRSLREGEVAV
jgi:hypothetical protein